MRVLGLKFILEGGSFLQILVPEHEAQHIIRSWLSGTLKGIIGNDGAETTGGGWGVDMSRVEAVHTIPVEQPATYQPPPQPRPVTPVGPAVPPVGQRFLSGM
jgi:hypothetical protein